MPNLICNKGGLKLIRFTFKFVFIVSLLLFGMLMGMNLAEKGIYEVTGNDQSPESFQISQNENQLEVKVLGNSYVSDLPSPDIIEEEADVIQENNNVESIKSDINLISSVGNKLGNLLHAGTEKGLTIISKLID